MENYKYDVAFSFAGEDRDYVEQVATYLREKDINVFYDEFNQIELWGKNLIDYLEQVYSVESKYCVMFISQAYTQKEWTCYESAVAASRMLKSNVKKREYILPVRFDNTRVPGILTSIAHISGNKFTPQELAEMIREKTSKEKTATSCYSFEQLFENVSTRLEGIAANHISTKKTQIAHSKYSLHFFRGKSLLYYILIEGRRLSDNLYVISIFESYQDPSYFLEAPSAEFLCIVSHGNVIQEVKVEDYGFFDGEAITIKSPPEIVERTHNQVAKTLQYLGV